MQVSAVATPSEFVPRERCGFWKVGALAGSVSHPPQLGSSIGGAGMGEHGRKERKNEGTGYLYTTRLPPVVPVFLWAFNGGERAEGGHWDQAATPAVA
ncbi:hypothetical protein GGTG_07096 [Gaeumannomyces tritici R3-111a-1]|uniref:Uncharacterized protein n=1 Tax=Gaeumannomyces tritici (strain R3-111a-1) TaxID=644352 RepID=J3P0Q1_GAET3|nr:hypothetical protein GGTG_07096 [Gaeumannomyces tritici R3-111a-1]EJT77184.1 hypothetical protein GGTG_07096 [Gaeumannomyces tritici R3-111a-1]